MKNLLTSLLFIGLLASCSEASESRAIDQHLDQEIAAKISTIKESQNNTVDPARIDSAVKKMLGSISPFDGVDKALPLY